MMNTIILEIPKMKYNFEELPCYNCIAFPKCINRTLIGMIINCSIIDNYLIEYSSDHKISKYRSDNLIEYYSQFRPETKPNYRDRTSIRLLSMRLRATKHAK